MPAAATCTPLISIHALREEGDAGTSARRPRPRSISIHALREEGDAGQLALRRQLHDFYPRPPRGGRHVAGYVTKKLYDFYPRPPRGGRPSGMTTPTSRDLFLSTPSARRATIEVHCPLLGFVISIHALREEGDHAVFCPRLLVAISIHALREEGDSKNRDKISIFKQIIQHSARI